jgi:hypothetical protein
LFGQYYWTSDNLNTDGISNGGKNQWKFPTYNECQENYRRCDSAGQNCVSKYGSCSTGGGHQCTDLNAQTCSTVSNCTGSYNSCTVNGYTYSSPLNATSSGPSYECPLEINPLTNNSTTLLSTINAMQPLGNTVINQGLQWGWNMLSPRWQGLWGGTMNANGLPLAYNTQGMVKALVLLTDGENTIGDSDHSSYWFLDSGRTGSTNGTTAVNDLNTKTQQLCNAMKAQGIYVYTIALGTDTTSTSLALLQNCATAVNYYWNSPSTTQLQGIFGQIGDSLANLRVSQ